MMARRDAIARAFGAAQDYDRHAAIQRRAAEALADRIAALDLTSPALLELGCGTGFLTQAMQARGIGGHWTVSDLAPPMVERCRQRVRGPHLTFAVLDIERDEPPAAGDYDLITASLAAQWFDDLDAAVARMLRWVRPGGHVLFNTLASGTFREWRDALAKAGAGAGTPVYPSVEQIAAIHRQAQVAPPAARVLHDRHDDARGFLASVKAIGAGVPARGHRPVGPAAMRAAMRHFEGAGSTATYEIVTCHFRRPLEDSRPLKDSRLLKDIGL